MTFWSHYMFGAGIAIQVMLMILSMPQWHLLDQNEVQHDVLIM